MAGGGEALLDMGAPPPACLQAKQMVEAASFTQSFKGSAFWMVGAGAGRRPDIKGLHCSYILPVITYILPISHVLPTAS